MKAQSGYQGYGVLDRRVVSKIDIVVVATLKEAVGGCRGSSCRCKARLLSLGNAAALASIKLESRVLSVLGKARVGSDH